MDHNINFSGSDQIQTPQYPDVHENPLTNDEFEAFMKANDDKINNLETEFDYFQKQCEQTQDDLLNQMRNFIQNFQSGPPGPNVAGFCWGGSRGDDCRCGLMEMGEKMAEKAIQLLGGKSGTDEQCFKVVG
nr:hypothetical protein [Tanacetum cinerariifolium]